MSERLEGVVISFNNDRGFGFIKPDDGSDDYFVRHTEVVVGGFRSLSEGARVRFEPSVDPATGNRQALEVHLLP